MKKTFLYLALAATCLTTARAQLHIPYDPAAQPAGNIQYFKPAGDNLFVGDCIPFYHEGTYYLYWLLDQGHHAALGGLGGHQWCVSTSTDLKQWAHHPVAIGIDEAWEKSICTGSVAFDGQQYYAFYATRLVAPDGQVKEQLSYAVSPDGLTFRKQQPNPFYTSAPGYSSRHFRDPKVVIDENGLFHLFVSSESDTYVLREGRGCLVHLVSRDLKNWQVEKPLLSGQREVPECPDYFRWNDWYYLVYGQGGDTYYVKSRSPYGPWEYPRSQALLEQWVNVAKTAEFKGNRRIVAGWIPSKEDEKDYGRERFGGSIVLREAYPLPNGDLATKFPAETAPAPLSPLPLTPVPAENARQLSDEAVILDAPGSLGVALINDLPYSCRITARIEPSGNLQEYGFFLRSGDSSGEGYKLSLHPNQRTVRLGDDAYIEAVEDLDKPLDIEIRMKDDIIDVCIDNRRCLVNRLPQQKGNTLRLYAKQGKVVIKNIRIYPFSD